MKRARCFLECEISTKFVEGNDAVLYFQLVAAAVNAVADAFLCKYLR